MALCDSGRLFVRNLPYGITEDELEQLFAQFGDIADVHMPLDKTKKPKGFAFVRFIVAEHAIQALQGLDGDFFKGRLLHIIPAKRKKEKKNDDEQQRNKSSTYKSKKDQEAKDAALRGKDPGASSNRSWS